MLAYLCSSLFSDTSLGCDFDMTTTALLEVGCLFFKAV